MFADPHFVHRGITAPVDHPKLGRVNVLNTPFKFSGTPARVRSSSPLRGEHTTEVLSQILDYGDAEIACLRREGVVE